jgi:CBS domain containing-hemolysin-like protein
MTKKAELADNQKKFISGALDLKNKCVINVMVPINNVFKLDINSCLDFETFRDIGDHGYSRIPLYEHTE